jgi:ABC-type Fe3+-hydroxamate transport system substrate-binding protein
LTATRTIYNEITHQKLIVPQKCERIVSFSPAITEALFLMGLDDFVKGVSVYCVHPEEARKKKIVGAYNSFKEKVVDEINPDIIFTTTGYQIELFEKLLKKYPVYPLRLPPTLSELIANSVEAGIVAGYVKEARELQSRLFDELEELKKIKSNSSLKLYIEIDLGGPVTFGAYSYITDGIEFLGFENIFGDEPCEWMTPDDKLVSQLNPDIIIYEPKMFSKNRDREEIKNRLISRFGEIKALKEDRLFITPTNYDFFAHHGPGFILVTLKWLANLANQ